MPGAEGPKAEVIREDAEITTTTKDTAKEIEKEDDSEETQGEDLLEAAAKAAADAAAEQKRKQDLLNGPASSPAQQSEDSSPVDSTMHIPHTNSELMSSHGTSDFYAEDKCPEDDLGDENPDDVDDFNDPDDERIDIDDAELELDEKLAATEELPPPLSQMSNMAASLLPDSNVKLEKLQSTRVAVAQFAENNMPNLVSGQPTDLATLQSAIYTLQQQQLIQLQILQQLQQQLMAGMAPSMSNLQAMMQATQSLLPPIAAMAKLTPQVANTAPGSNLSPPSGTSATPMAPASGQEASNSRSKSPAAADRKSTNQDETKEDQFGFSHKLEPPGSPMSHLTKMVEVGKYANCTKAIVISMLSVRFYLTS